MRYDLVIIGSGPAGYIAAVRAGQTGLKTVVIEDKKIGGMCLNWGCIPTKSLIESAKKLTQVRNSHSFGVDGVEKNKISLNWEKVRKRTDTIVKRLGKGIESLFRKNSIEYVQGRASIVSEGLVEVNGEKIETDKIIIATGSKPGEVKLDLPVDEIKEVYELLTSEKLPESPVIIGSGPHAVELAQFFNLAGSKVVLLSDREELLPSFDKSLVDFAGNMLKKAGIEVLKQTDLNGYSKGALHFGENRVEYDMLINCTDRIAVVPDSAPALELNEGFIQVDDLFRTNIPGVYAVGDVNGKSSFAHIASAQGIAAVNNINGIIPVTDMKLYPVNMYTWPEIAQIGKTEEELKFSDTAYNITKIPFASNGKAIIEDQKSGFIRILSEKKFGEVLGVQIVAENATDMISEAAALIQLEGTVYDLSTVIHSHPTVSEVFMEGGFSAFEMLDKS